MDFSKPRVAIYYFVVPQTGWRNDGPPLFINYNLRKILNGKVEMGDQMGNVAHLQPIPHSDKFGKFDLHLLVDHGEDAIGVPLDWELPRPSAYWISDAHLGYEYRMKRAKQMDYVFVAQKAFVEQLVSDGIPRDKIFYLPHAAEPVVYKPYSIIERWDWCFIGHLNNEFRINLCDRFAKEFGLGDGKGYLGWRIPQFVGHNLLDDVAKKFSQSKIVLNENIKEDVNMRTFEALACRRFLLTEDIPELHDLFENKTDLWMYRSIDEAVQIARAILVDHEQRIRIAESGYRKFLENHTYKHRAAQILKTCLQYETKGELAHVV